MVAVRIVQRSSPEPSVRFGVNELALAVKRRLAVKLSWVSAAVIDSRRLC